MDSGGKCSPVSLQADHWSYSLQVVLAAACMPTSFSSRMCMNPLDSGLIQRNFDDSGE